MGRAAAFLGRICSHILQFAVVLFGVTLLTFSIMHFSPKNPLSFGWRLTEMSERYPRKP